MAFAGLFTWFNLRNIQATARTNKILTFAMGLVIAAMLYFSVRFFLLHYKPEMDKIHQVQVNKIKKFLKAEQLSEFEKMEREREEKMRARESGPGI